VWSLCYLSDMIASVTAATMMQVQMNWGNNRRRS
jgi:hypothetical protein